MDTMAVKTNVIDTIAKDTCARFRVEEHEINIFCTITQIL